MKTTISRLALVAGTVVATCCAGAAVRYTSGGANNDYSFAIATDPATGDVYVGGSAYINAARRNDMYLIKYNFAGAIQWVRNFGSNGDDQINDVLFAAGQVYVTGYTQPIGGNKDVSLLHYNSAGALLQIRAFGGPGNDAGIELARDPAGNIYVGGVGDRPGTGQDFLALKYTGGLAPVWGVGWGIAGNDSFVSMALNGGGFYLVGSRTNGAGNSDGAVVRLNPATGGVVNARLIPGAAGFNDVTMDVALDGAGNVYTVTTQALSAVDSQIQTLKMTPALAITWVNNFNGFPGAPDQASRVRIGPAGNVLVGGASFGLTGANFDMVVNGVNGATGGNLAGFPTKYDNGGNDLVTDLVVDPAGNITMTGISNGVADDYATCQVFAGAVGWVTRYNFGVGDKPVEMAFGPNFTVFATGSSVGGASGLDWATVHYNQLTGANLW